MGEATTDPTLEALVPRGSAWRNAALVGLGLVLLVAAWLLPPLVRPSLGTTPGGSWQEFPSERQVVVVGGIEPRAWGGVRVQSVGDVPGAHVVAAWATDDDLWEAGRGDPTAPSTAAPAHDRGPSAQDYVASLGLTDDDRLPRTVAGDGDATLVVLWQLDGCTGQTGNPRIAVGSRWGVTSTIETLPFSVFLVDSQAETELCGS